MMLTHKSALLLVAAAMMLPAVAKADLIVNGGFETGHLDGWTCTGPVGSCLVETTSPHSGQDDVMAIDNAGFGTLSQTISTTAGSAYTLSFWTFVNNVADANIFQFAIDGAPATGVAQTHLYNQTTAGFVATGSATTISFSFATQEGSGAWFVDDISVVNAAAVPGPVIGAGLPGLMLAGGGLIGWWRRKRTPAAAA
jgi:carbohydrate binding protein with CBM4/9 domain